MTESNFPRYVLIFLGVIYLLGCIGEAVLVKNGAEMAFESIKTLVPHIGMFILGYYMSNNKTHQ